MPTFTAIALDRLLEPGASMSATDSERSNSTPARANGAGEDSKPVSVDHWKSSVPFPPPAHPNLVRRNSCVSRTTTAEKENASWPKISPALYSTPESTPLPDSPTLFSPSPYLINHKRRGPRLQQSFSEASASKETMVDEKAPTSSRLSDTEMERKSDSPVDDVVLAAQSNSAEEKKTIGLREDMVENRVIFDVNSERNDLPSMSTVDRESEIEDYYDPQESMSFTSNTDGEDIGTEPSARTNTSGGVFYDAWDELSSESGRQMQSSMNDLETELREMRLSLLMEVEKRTQAEDALKNMQSQWQRLREKLREVGLILPRDLSIVQDSQTNVDFTEEICQQIYVTRFVAESIGRVAARAECEEEMESQLEWKNFEIARLCDRLHYYETMNREMSQRNQEAIELARRDRQRRKRMQKWVCGSVATAVTLGSIALVWSYFPSGKSSSSHQPHASEPGPSTE